MVLFCFDLRFFFSISYNIIKYNDKKCIFIGCYSVFNQEKSKNNKKKKLYELLYGK